MSIAKSIGIIAIVAIIILAGYFTFILFFTQILPNATSFSLVLVAIIAAIATFFNPCSFPTLPVYLTRFYSAGEETKPKNRLNSILFYGLLVSLGIIVFNTLFGALIGLLGEGFAKSFALGGVDVPNLYVLIFRGIIGVLLISLGLMTLLGRGFHGIFGRIGRLFSSGQSKSPSRSMFLYGFGYNAIGIGCAGPIMASLAVFALASGGIFSAITAFLVFSITMSILMTGLSFLVGKSKTETIRKLSMKTGTIKKISSVIIILVGIYLLLSSIYVREFVSLLFPG